MPALIISHMTLDDDGSDFKPVDCLLQAVAACAEQHETSNYVIGTRVCEQDNKTGGGACALDRQRLRGNEGEEERETEKEGRFVRSHSGRGEQKKEEKDAKTTETHSPWISREERR